MKTQPLVSVIITTYYRNDRVQNAIESTIQQTYDPVEIIIVDDSGERHAESALQSYDIDKYIPHHDEKGMAASRNSGAAAAEGDMIHFLDDDDILQEEAVAKKVSVAIDTGCDVVYSGIWRERDSTSLLPNPTQIQPHEFLSTALSMQLPPCYPSTMLISASVLDRVLPIKADFHGSEDVVLCIELSKETKFVAIRDPLTTLGVGDQAMSESQTAIEARKRVLERYSDLYDNHPNEIRKQAEAGVTKTKGLYQLNEKGWSPMASFALCKAALTYPGIQYEWLAGGVLSLFGKRTFRIGRKVFVKHL